MITDPWFYAAAVPAILLVGVSKSGFGAGFGSLGLPLMAMAVPLPRALPGRSLAELGFLVPSKLPQGSLEPRDSAPSKRGLQHG